MVTKSRESIYMKTVYIIKHVSSEGPGTLGEYFDKNRIGQVIINADQEQSARLSGIKLSQAKGLVILGGPMNVYETGKYPFLEMELQLIREALSCQVPLLGVCLGAQLLASALGAQVKRAPVRELGWYNLELMAAAATDPLMKSFDPKIDVFQWHEDTFDVPQTGVLLAQGSSMPQAFRVGASAWGFQFHVEVDKEMIADWCAASVQKDLPQVLRLQMQSGYDKIEKAFRAQAERIFEAFSSFF